MNKFITPVIFVLLAVGIFFAYIDPQWQEIKTLKASNEEYNKAIQRSKQLLQIRDKLLDKYNGFKSEDLHKVEKLLPDNIDNVRLIIDINSITSKYGASIKNVRLNTGTESTETTAGANQPVANPSGQPYNSMILSFSISAPYSTFLSILADLERSLRLIDVTSVAFKAGDSEPYDYDVSIRTYWLK